MAESYQHRLDRVRKPRIHITFDVETGGKKAKKELPFVVGVLGDYSGNNPSQPLKPLSERKFVQVDRDNFNDVLARMAPGLKLKVENTLAGDGSEMSVDLQFRSMEDFEPGRVAQQVEPLRKLLEARQKIDELKTKADSKEKLEGLLEKILKSSPEEIRKVLEDHLGQSGGKA